ncbi:MAG TPA: GGDEF domain-containing protein [Actinomycetes bacterium]|nr:GGDEF domain-containing protein [Actinomycetes bacterium]
MSTAAIQAARSPAVNATVGSTSPRGTLRVVAARLDEVARPGDLPGRWGGEEFLVVLPETGPEEAAAMGERTRRAIAAAPVPLADGPLAVTTSVGVASGAEDGWECLVRRADTGLYAAKEGGRDRVAGPPPEPPAGSRSSTPEGRDGARYR